MSEIHFGVIDQPYRWEQEQLTKRGKIAKRRASRTRSITTGEVAERLEKNYQVMEHFFQENEEFIVNELTSSLDKSLEAVLTGAPADTHDTFGPAATAIRARWIEFIDGQEMDGRVVGVPTVASGNVPSVREGGINHRLSHPYAKANPPRPSFVDTGNYENSFIMWIEE